MRRFGFLFVGFKFLKSGVDEAFSSSGADHGDEIGVGFDDDGMVGFVPSSVSLIIGSFLIILK